MKPFLTLHDSTHKVTCLVAVDQIALVTAYEIGQDDSGRGEPKTPVFGSRVDLKMDRSYVFVLETPDEILAALEELMKAEAGE